MVYIEKKNAMKAFYYLMSADGNIDTEELEIFALIGKEICGNDFDEYKYALIEECSVQIASAFSEEEKLDVIQEGLDEALKASDNGSKDGIPIRLLIWNMLVLAYCNDTYDEAERKLIYHVVRTTKTDRNVLSEMEQTIKAYTAVGKQLEWIQSSDKPYSEVRPIVDELEKRQRNLIGNAKALIGDEAETDEAYVPKQKVLDKAKEKIGEKINPIASEIGEKLNPIASEIGDKAKKTAEGAKAAFGEKVVPAAKNLKLGAGKMFEALKEKTKKKPASDSPESTKKDDE